MTELATKTFRFIGGPYEGEHEIECRSDGAPLAPICFMATTPYRAAHDGDEWVFRIDGDTPKASN